MTMMSLKASTLRLSNYSFDLAVVQPDDRRRHPHCLVAVRTLTELHLLCGGDFGVAGRAVKPFLLGIPFHCSPPLSFGAFPAMGGRRVRAHPASGTRRGQRAPGRPRWIPTLGTPRRRR